ncbi:hypothetical protein [Sphingomonas echinoides]|uniref:hypothetical protein n=1 Tax=Sphingomonas echinoides TaxID=59803 RepID=UPI00241313A8|nr:hypothetical protein [Sphingomonas echinoides]
MRIDQLEPTSSSADPFEIPSELLESVRRHQSHLSALIVSLRAAGLDDDVVDASVRTLVDSYADDLTVAIRTMMKESHNG